VPQIVPSIALVLALAYKGGAAVASVEHESPMTQFSMTALPSEDRTTAKLVLELGPDVRLEANLDVAAIDQAIDSLARVRASLVPPIPAKVTSGDRVSVRTDYKWQVREGKIEDRRILSLRHPGFGWLNFAMPDDDAKDLAQWLTRNMD
jgi:hypothetical protein